MADTSWMARFGARLVTNGYAILPIGPGTKKPGRFQRGGWVDYLEWNRHAERPTTEVEVATWAAWPDCGIGIVGGAVAAVDIDIAADAELALQIEALARTRLGDTPALRIGRAPKRMLVYRTAAPFRGIKRHPLEVLCLGQQFLAYADHPDTGAPYVWPDEGLADLDISDLPEITEEAATAFLEEAYAILPEALRQRGLRSAAPATVLRNHGQIGTLPAIRSALDWLPNDELDYDSWMRIGMALKGALGDEGGEVFATWSAQAAKDVPATTARACLCVYGTTTPLHFWGALQGANVVDGSLARFLILPSDEDYPDENLAVGIRQAPPTLIQALQQVTKGGGTVKGNLTGKTADQNTAVNPMTVPMSDAARARFAELSDALTEELRAAAGTAFTAILARIGENALKLALIVAVGRDPVRPEIDITAADWAIGFVRHYARRTMEAVERHVADTETEAHLKRLKEIVRAAGPKGITKSEITRASQWLKSRDRDEILLTLIESGDITTGMRGSSTKQAMVYRMARWGG